MRRFMLFNAMFMLTTKTVVNYNVENGRSHLEDR